MTQKRSLTSKFNSNITKTLVLILFSALLLLILETYLEDVPKPQIKPTYKDGQYFTPKYSINTPKYSINTPKCKIPEINPFDSETLNLIHPEKYTPCSKYPPLTYIKKINETTTLYINERLKSLYSLLQISCCFSEVHRDSKSFKPDNDVRISSCTKFDNSVEVSADVIFVYCWNIFFYDVYKNVHAIIKPESVEKKRKLNPETTYSVLLVGIDSISKTHLARVMPKTHTYLEKNKNFHGLKGYTKIGLNTFPNLMGVLSGLNLEQIEKTCSYVNHVDECPNIWKTFRKMGYVTAYGEDTVMISSFNYQKKGFAKPPTDFYFRPYIIAAEKLGVVERYNMDYCAGPETEAERIMNLIKDFQKSFTGVPTFGLFWMNTFSHDNANMPGSMDGKIREFLNAITKSMKKTIFIFFSDHGIRFGVLRKSSSGWIEENTPFFYIYIPEVFKLNHPEFYNSVKINTKRLTTPYDIYMTLQDILHLADQNYSISQSLGCPLCQSLFKNITIYRNCKDAAISPKWCVCNVDAYVTPEESLKTKVADFLVHEINRLVSTYPEGHKCQLYKLGKIKFAGISLAQKFLLKVEMTPKAVFEGLFEIQPRLRLIGTITTLDRYAPRSWCTRKSSLERYCYCKGSFWSVLREKICAYLGC